jgi:hypothetical protein
MLIVKASSIKQFLDEIGPPDNGFGIPTTVRISTNESSNGNRIAVIKDVGIDVQTISYENGRQIILWFHHGFRIDFGPRGDQPWTEHDKAIYAAMDELEQMLREHFANMGYDVRGGLYGIPEDIKPLNGDLSDLVAWDSVTLTFVYTEDLEENIPF